jgi:hypothetical protein
MHEEKRFLGRRRHRWKNNVRDLTFNICGFTVLELASSGWVLTDYTASEFC